MAASVRCPGCGATCEVPAELLGRTGRCNTCGQRIRLATPTAELLDPSPDLPQLDDLGELEPVGDLLTAEPAKSATKRPLAPVVVPPADEAPPHAKRVRSAPPRGTPKWLFAAVALVGLLGGSASGALAVRYLLPPNEPKPEVARPVDPPTPAPTPAPNPPEPKPPTPEPEPKPKPPEPKPAPALAGPKVEIKLPGPAAAVHASSERFVVFQTVAGPLAVYDAQLGRPFFTVNGANPDDLVAVSRSKLYLGRAKDSQIAKFDLATGKGDGQATFGGAAASLRHLAIGTAADGPLLVVMRVNESAYSIRLLDTENFALINYPIDDPSAPRLQTFPLNETSTPRFVAMSGDGRAVMLGNRYYTRADNRFTGGLLANTGSAQHLPTADARGFVGTRLYDDAGIPIEAALPPGVLRRYLPAAGGPFVVSAEYKVNDPGTVKLQLHLGADPNPLGPLPGGDEVAAWARGDAGWVSKLNQRVAFVSDPPRLILCGPNSDTASAYPINLSALLAQAGHDVCFTSTPPAEAYVGEAYSYRATAVSALGPVTFALEAGPPGLTVTRDGALSWPNPTAERLSHKVALTATAGGKSVTQAFRLLVVQRPKAK